MKILPFAKYIKRLTERCKCSSCDKQIIFKRFNYDHCTLKYGGIIYSYGHCISCNDETQVFLSISSLKESFIEENEGEEANVFKTMYLTNAIK